jgi:hypothetical protein
MPGYPRGVFENEFTDFPPPAGTPPRTPAAPCTLPDPGFSAASPPRRASSGVAVRKDAELVPLWVSQHDPALIARLTDVGVLST